MSGWTTAPPETAHRKIHAIYAYWRSIAPEPGVLPGRRHVDPVDIPRLLDNIWLLDVVGAPPPRFRFRLIGDAPRRMGIPGRPGTFMDEFLRGGLRSPALDELHAIVRDRTPTWFRGPAHLPHRSEMFELERMIMPLAADGVTVDMLLCLTVFYRLNGDEIG